VIAAYFLSIMQGKDLNTCKLGFKPMKDSWDLSKRKWLYWAGVVGFVLTFQLFLWVIAVILYFTCDKGKPKTKNYQIEKVFEKYMIVAGNLGLVVLLIDVILMCFGINTFVA
jgi:hypothetical protein